MGGGFRGRAWGADVLPIPPHGFDPLPTQWVPLCTILRYPFLANVPKSFPLAPIFLRVKHAPKKRDFLVNIFQKPLKKPFWQVFFSKCCLWRKKLGQNRAFVMHWDSSENQFDRPKKVAKIFEFFRKSAPPPFEKILDQPLI